MLEVIIGLLLLVTCDASAHAISMPYSAFSIFASTALFFTRTPITEAVSESVVNVTDFPLNSTASAGAPAKTTAAAATTLSTEKMALKMYHPKPRLRVKVNLLGRLGNNLFQFASGYGIAAKYNATFCLQGDRSLLTIAFGTKFSTFGGCPGWSSPVVRENGYATYEAFSVINKAGGLTLGVPGGNNGFLQSWRYFEE